MRKFSACKGEADVDKIMRRWQIDPAQAPLLRFDALSMADGRGSASRFKG